MTREEGLGRALEVRLTVEAGRLVDAVGSAIVGAEDLLVFAGGIARRDKCWGGMGSGPDARSREHVIGVVDEGKPPAPMVDLMRETGWYCVGLKLPIPSPFVKI